jgi:hypothetical protein
VLAPLVELGALCLLSKMLPVLLPRCGAAPSLAALLLAPAAPLPLRLLVGVRRCEATCGPPGAERR